MSHNNPVVDAHRALEHAEAEIAKAEQARDQAAARLDAALAARGWRRVTGAFAPGATPLYTRLGGNSVELGDVLTEFEREPIT